MKKVLAILLVLIMVVPMGMVAQVEGAGAEIEPFYLVNWSPIPEGVEGDKVYDFYTLWTNAPAADAKELYVFAKYRNIGNDIPALAADMKAVFDDRPVGTRYMFILGRLEANVEHYVYMDKGVKLLKEFLEKFYAEYKRIGGELDGLIIDMEYNRYGAHYLDASYRADSLLYKKIVDDPRYQEKIRPKLVERGFHFWPYVTNTRPEIYTIYEKAGSVYAQNRDIWYLAMRDVMCEYMDEACSPLFKYYPNAYLSNYRYYASKSWIKTQDKRGDISDNGNLSYVGNTTNENTYLARPEDTYFKDGELTFNYPVSYNATHLQANKFNSFMWDVAVFKNMMMASDTENMSAWITGHNYNADSAHSVSNSSYYTELYLHIGLMNPEPFIGYVTHNMSEYADSMQILSDIMDELTRVAGYADRKYIKLPHNWNYGFALTGMYAGGRNIWRITPDLTGDMTLEGFKVNGGTDPTFRINGQTVTFPGGKIIKDGAVREVGTCGYWVETPANVMPVITSDANRYEMFPAFEENFDGYATGMEYTDNNVEFPTSWLTEKGENATAVIREDKTNAGNKVLALTGDFTLKNTKVTQNITAGDTYAEEQTWEVAVTVPSDMAADATVTLLAIYGDKNALLDGGFQIAGGKLYYYDGEKYTAFEGVEASAGSKFILKRVMDFNTADAFTCDYIVCDADKKELAAVKDIPVDKDVKIPVQFIGFSVSKVAGNPVLLDNYKLYASGISMDFELYEAALGLKIADADVDKARTADTAYRVSWMNATDSEKVYSVVAEYSNGDIKYIKEIKMAPNTDAVETGVVEVAEGQSVRIYIRSGGKPIPEGGGTDSDPTGPADTIDPTGSAGTTDSTGSAGTPDPTELAGTPDSTGPADTFEKDGSAMLIVMIAGAAVLAAAIVAVIVVVNKKKKAAPTAEEIKDETAE